MRHSATKLAIENVGWPRYLRIWWRKSGGRTIYPGKAVHRVLRNPGDKKWSPTVGNEDVVSGTSEIVFPDQDS